MKTFILCKKCKKPHFFKVGIAKAPVFQSRATGRHVNECKVYMPDACPNCGDKDWLK